MGKITCYVDGVPRQIEVDLNYIHQPKLKLLRIALRYVCMRVCVCVRTCVCVCVRASVYACVLGYASVCTHI